MNPSKTADYCIIFPVFQYKNDNSVPAPDKIKLENRYKFKKLFIFRLFQI